MRLSESPLVQSHRQTATILVYADAGQPWLVAVAVFALSGLVNDVFRLLCFSWQKIWPTNARARGRC